MYQFITIIMLLLLLFIVKLTTRNWLQPYFVMSVMWVVFIIAALIVFKNEVSWNCMGFIWIILACAFFMVGNIIGMSKKKYNITKCSEKKEVSSLSWKLIIIFIILGLLRSVIEIKINGFSFSNLLNLNNLLEINNSMAIQRYNGGNLNNHIMQILLIFVYAAPLCGGYGFLYSKSKYQRMICILTFLPSLVSLLVTNAKAVLIASVFLWLSSFLVAYLDKYKKAPKLKKIVNIKFIIALLLILLILYISMVLRTGKINADVINRINDKFKIYSLGHVFAFDNWFSNNPHNVDYTLGKYTFFSIFDTLGLVVREQGIFTDFTYNLMGNGTNVYTAFRGIISDFGTIGGLIFFIIMGIFSGYSFNKVSQKGKKYISSILILSSTYFFIFYSMIVSPWSYNSYIMAFIVFGFYLFVSWRKIV